MNRKHMLGLLAGALVAGATAIPAFAEEAKGNRPEAAGEKANHGETALAKRHGAQGTVDEVDSAKKMFVLVTKQGRLAVKTDEHTKYRMPHEEHPTFASLKKGLRVAVEGERADEKTLLASHVNMLPAKEEHGEADAAKAKSEAKKQERGEKHAEKGRTVTVGVASNVNIAANGTGGLTVTPQGGSAVTFVVNADTEYQLKGVAGLANGQTIRVQSVKDGSTNVARRIRVPAGD